MSRLYVTMFSLPIVMLATVESQPSPSQTSSQAVAQVAAQSAVGKNPESSLDSKTLGCSQPDRQEPVTFDQVKGMVSAKVPEKVLLEWIGLHSGELHVNPDQISALQEAGATESLLTALSAGPDVYIGWSVIPAKVVRDNYGRNVTNKFFGIDVAVANRSSDTVIINTLEFCRQMDQRDVSQDPALVRGSLLKGQLTGRRTIIRGSMVAISLAATPAAPFFKNVAHQNNFHTGLAILNQFPVAFDDIVPETTLKYLEDWDKDEVFKKGFVVAGGASSRGRIFIPIELIYPPSDKTNWKQATSGKYDPSIVKQQIGVLIVLGQSVQKMSPRRFVNGPQ